MKNIYDYAAGVRVVHYLVWDKGTYNKFYDWLQNDVKNMHEGIYFIYAQGNSTSPDIPHPGIVGYVILLKVTNTDFNYTEWWYLGSGRIYNSGMSSSGFNWVQKV